MLKELPPYNCTCRPNGLKKPLHVDTAWVLYCISLRSLYQWVHVFFCFVLFLFFFPNFENLVWFCAQSLQMGTYFQKKKKSTPWYEYGFLVLAATTLTKPNLYLLSLGSTGLHQWSSSNLYLLSLGSTGLHQWSSSNLYLLSLGSTGLHQWSSSKKKKHPLIWVWVFSLGRHNSD